MAIHTAVVPEGRGSTGHRTRVSQRQNHCCSAVRGNISQNKKDADQLRTTDGSGNVKCVDHSADGSSRFQIAHANSHDKSTGDTRDKHSTRHQTTLPHHNLPHHPPQHRRTSLPWVHSAGGEYAQRWTTSTAAGEELTRTSYASSCNNQ